MSIRSLLPSSSTLISQYRQRKHRSSSDAAPLHRSRLTACTVLCHAGELQQCSTTVQAVTLHQFR
eukprot:3676961-Rhodomonas_salina.1